MDPNDQWMPIEEQLVQLTGEVRERRAKMQRLQAALDDTRSELGRVRGDLQAMRTRADGTGDEPGSEAVPRHALQVQARQVEAIEAVVDQLRELVALHRVFRDLARVLREVTGNHEARIRALEGRLFGGGPAVH